MFAAYQRDLKLISDNCIQYNGEESIIGKAAVKFEKGGIVSLNKVGAGRATSGP